jgi:hypothetical protein
MDAGMTLEWDFAGGPHWHQELAAMSPPTKLFFLIVQKELARMP